MTTDGSQGARDDPDDDVVEGTCTVVLFTKLASEEGPVALWSVMSRPVG
jgi:hypothetical protein